MLPAVLAGGCRLAQPSVRRATNVAALLAYPSFYHLRLDRDRRAAHLQTSGELRLSDEHRSLRVISEGNVPTGSNEVRGEFWDIGRLNSDDPRLAVYDLRVDVSSSIPTVRGRAR